MKILFASAEALPHYKTGGLADVARALPDALAARGHEVRVVMPGYDFLGSTLASTKAVAELTVPWPSGPVPVSMAALDDDAHPAPLTFVRTHTLFATDRPYDAVPGDPLSLPRRFAFFARAVVAYANHWGADVVHLNEWQTGLVPVYALLDRLRAATVYSIHNLAYQGNFPSLVLPQVGVPPELFRTENGVEFYGHASFLKAALALADRIVTVSRTHAREIQTPEYGYGFDGLLAFRRRILHGVLNGIDTAAWNPATDPLLPITYTARTVARKTQLRAALLERVGLDAAGPVLGMVSRLAHQKGIDVLIAALPPLIEAGCRVIVLGNGEPRYQHALVNFAQRAPNSIVYRPGFDEPLARLIYAGADFFLMPSLYEPSGLGQMIAQRYGTPPIARRTGGLNDTIADGVTGFLFRDATPQSLVDAVLRATAVWQRRGWRALQTRCMSQDHSWTRSALEYERVYEYAVGAG